MLTDATLPQQCQQIQLFYIKSPTARPQGNALFILTEFLKDQFRMGLGSN